jgi:hypothetical protein
MQTKPPPPQQQQQLQKEEEEFRAPNEPEFQPKGFAVAQLISVHHGFSDRKNRLLTIPIHLEALL